jgi:hypothetical protein
MQSEQKHNTGAVVHFSAFIMNADGEAIDMVMTDPVRHHPMLLDLINSGKQPATEDFKERINAYHPQ